MKKILFITRPICPPWDEASKNFAFFLAKNLANKLDFTLLTKDYVEELPEKVTQLPIYTSSAMSMSLWQKAKILKVAKKRDEFDVIHFMLTPAKLNSLGFKFFFGKGKAKTVQTVATLREDLFSESEFKKILFADRIVTYSDYAKNKLQKMGFNNVTRIYPGIDIEKYAPQPKDIQTMEHFDIKGSDFVITYPGEYVRLGATDDLVSIIPELVKQIPNLKFVFANRVKNEKDARKKEEVVKKLEGAGLLDHIVFTDTFSDMPKIYNMSDIILFPAQNMHGKFDVPLAVVEAYASAKPVIISDLPVLSEFASDNNSVIIPKGDKAALCREIFSLAKDADMRERVGSAACAFARENFDIRDVAAKYENLYLNL